MKKALSKKKKQTQLISFLSGAVCVLAGTVVVLLGTLFIQTYLEPESNNTSVYTAGLSITLSGVFSILFGTVTIMFGKITLPARNLVRNIRQVKFSKNKIVSSELKNIPVNKKAA